MTAQETIQLMTSRGEKSPRLRAAKSGKLPSEGSPASKTPRSEGLVRAGLPSGNGGLVERADERGHAGDVELCKSSVDRSGRPHVVCDAEPDGGARPAGEHGKGEHSGESQFALWRGTDACVTGGAGNGGCFSLGACRDSRVRVTRNPVTYVSTVVRLYLLSPCIA
eukprot:1839257-Prymnesium_polylepis.1